MCVYNNFMMVVGLEWNHGAMLNSILQIRKRRVLSVQPGHDRARRDGDGRPPEEKKKVIQRFTVFPRGISNDLEDTIPPRCSVVG